MAFGTLLCAMTLTTAMAPGLRVEPVSEQKLAEVVKQVSFTVYRPNSIPLGYSMVRASIVSMNSIKVVKLTYLNPESKNSFDLLQSPSSNSSVKQSMRKIGASELTTDTTFTAVRRGSTDIGFFGTMISLPSAEKLMGGLVAIKKN